MFAIAAGWEEIITPLELTLELYDKKDQLTPESLRDVLKDKYKPMAGNPGKIVLLDPTEVDALVKECTETELNLGFLNAAYSAVTAYRAAQR